MLDAANYLIANGYHRLFADGGIIETTEFAAREGAADARPAAPMMVVVDRVSVTGEAEVERVREALEGQQTPAPGH